MIDTIEQDVEKKLPTHLSEVDRLTVELAKSQRQTALANAKTALAEQEKTEINYKLLITQLFMKYGLTSEDSIVDGGEIVRGGNVR